jgi:hypothetical protein
MAKEKGNYYFTFGSGQGLAGHYVIIKAYTYEAARDEMFRLFGKHWSFQYDEQGWNKEGKPYNEIYGWQLFKTYDAGWHGYDEAQEVKNEQE